MKPTRRKTMLGLGALATGSGAVFTSSSFSGSAEADSDFRVVTEGSLVVEPNDNVSNASDIAHNKSDPSAHLFKNSSSLSGNKSFSEVDNSGEAAVNNQTNDNLELAIAVADDTSTKFNILQVTNNGDTPENVGATISGYGGDVGSSSITRTQVNNAFTFDIEDSDGDYQDVSSGNHVFVDSGDTRGLRIAVDISQINDDDLANASASASGGNVFGSSPATNTVDLVDKIKIGVQ